MMDEGANCDFSKFRRRHSALMREVLRSEGVSAASEKVKDFLSELVALGAELPGEDDRASAQSILDYWSAALADGGEFRQPRQPLKLEPYQGRSWQGGMVSSASARPEGNPFRDLAVVSRNEGTRLPGREDAIRAVLEMLDARNLVFVTGAAGSGRSALVNAGVLWQIESSATPDQVFRIATPAPDPLSALAGCVPGASANEISSGSSKFRERFDIACGDRRGLLVVDNLEELFTRCSDQPAREAFAAAILSLCAPGRDGVSHRAILILRDEWAEQVLALKAFGPVAKETRFTPPPPTASELRRTIEIPAEAAGLSFEAGIVEDLSRELQGDGGALALVQFMLMQLWPLSPDCRVTWEIYRKLGRPYDALTKVAEDTFVGLSAEDREAAHDMFLKLTRPGLDRPGGAGARSRRESRTVLEADGAKAAIAAFEAAGLLRASGSGAGDDSIEIVHDDLMYRWDRLVEWLVDERRRTERRTTLLASARLWQASGRPVGYLIADKASLEEANQYASSATELDDLIAESRRYIRRQEWMRTARIAILVLLVVALAAAATTALFQSRDARSAATKATNAAELAEREAAAARLAEAESRRNLEIAQQVARGRQSVIDRLTEQIRGYEARLSPSAGPTPNSSAMNQAALAAANFVPDSVLDVYGARPGASGRIVGYLWVGSDEKPNIEGNKLPSAIKPGDRLTLSKNIVLRQTRPTDDYTQAPSLGVLPAGSTIVATGAPIPYNRTLGLQYWLPVEADPPPPSVAFQFASAPPGKPDAIANALKGLGYQVPGIEQTDIGKGVNEVRWFNQQDKSAADKLARQVNEILKAQGLSTTVKAVDFTASRYKVQPGKVELWLDVPKT